MQRHRAAFRGVRDGEEQDKMGRSKKVESKERREEIQKNEGELGCLTCVILPPPFP